MKKQETGDRKNTVILQSNRKLWIDGLRALAMLFVIFGHQASGHTGYFVFTSPIKIPLFFMVTGYVFNDKRASVRDFFRNLWLKLIIPWLCLTLPFHLIRIPFKGMRALVELPYRMLSGEIAWYMPCCIVAEIIWFFIRKYARKESSTCLGALIVFALGIVAGYLNILNFAMINRAMLMQLFILSGYLYRLHEKHFMRLSWVPVVALIAAYIAMGLISLRIWPSKNLDVHLNKYYNLPYCFAMMILGCFTLFILANKAGSAPRVLSFIGQNTLVYYLLHAYNIKACVLVMTLLNIHLPGFIVDACVKTFIACVACGIEAILINRYLPEIVGKKRIHTTA